MNNFSVRATRVSDCQGCPDHNRNSCGVRRCVRCMEPCWVDKTGMRLVTTLNSPVYCGECAEKPNAILVVSEADFDRAVTEAKRERDARLRMLEGN